jgi:hypothetical protein
MLVRLTKLILVVVLGSMLSACDDPQVYGSVGVSSWGGSGSSHRGGSRTSGSVSIGGRIH